MMNIFHIRASNFYGGPERQLHLHAKMANQQGYNVAIGSFLENGQQPEFLDTIANDNIKTHTFDVSSAYDTATIGKLRAYLKNNNIDILCSHDYRTHLLSWLACPRDVKWLAFSRGFTLDNFKVRLYHWAEKISIRFTDHIIAVSQAQKNKLTRLLINKNKIKVAYNAIDPDGFDNNLKIDLKKQYQFSDNAVVIVTAGRFSKEKGQSVLVKAAAIALQSNPDLRFILYGDGPDLEDINEQVKNSSLENKIITPGFERNVIGCMKDADILVNPSLSEGLPNVVLEGMAMGVPVVATAVGGVPELITNMENGLTVPADNPEKLAEAILQLADNKTLRIELVQAAKNTIKSSFSFDRQFKIITDVYQSLAGKTQ